jgi:hypothetical protein
MTTLRLCWIGSCLKNGNDSRPFARHVRRALFPAWSPHGEALTFVDNQVIEIVSLQGEELAVKTKGRHDLAVYSEVLWLPKRSRRRVGYPNRFQASDF